MKRYLLEQNYMREAAPHPAKITLVGGIMYNLFRNLIELIHIKCRHKILKVHLRAWHLSMPVILHNSPRTTNTTSLELGVFPSNTLPQDLTSKTKVSVAVPGLIPRRLNLTTHDQGPVTSRAQ